MAKTSNAKQKICEHAQRLFHEKGYDNVSLRDIAEAAGTTIGNLTYHYPQKENLITSIQENLHNLYTDELLMSDNNELLLTNMLTSFAKAQKNKEENPFYFRNIIELCKNSETMFKSNEAFRLRLYNYYLSCFVQLKECGWMRADITDQQYQTLAYLIVVMTTVWIQNASPYYDAALPHIELIEALHHIIVPYLTEQGLMMYQNVLMTMEIEK